MPGNLFHGIEGRETCFPSLNGNFAKGGAIMQIAKTTYFKDLTSFLDGVDGVKIYDDAITVITPSIAIHFSRISKNNYQTVVIWEGATFNYHDSSLASAMVRIKELVDSHAV